MSMRLIYIIRFLSYNLIIKERERMSRSFMKITLIGEPRVVMSNPDGRHKYFGWPTAARLQNGKIAVVASGFRLAHVCPFGKTVISYSEDEGQTFTKPCPVIDTPLDDRDGGILAYGKSNVIVTSFNNTREFQRKSTDNPYCLSYLDTISDEDEEKYLGASYRISCDFGVNFGETRKCPVTIPHGPLELPDGSLIFIGRPYNHREVKDCIKAYKLLDNGEFEFNGEIEDIYNSKGEKATSCEPHSILLNDGKILTQMRVQLAGYFTIFQSESDDGGKTWSKPRQLLSDFGGAPPHLMRHSSGRLVSSYCLREAPFVVRVMISEDEGKTWDIDHDIYVNRVSPDMGYPSTVELKDNSLLTVFYAIPKDGEKAIIMSQQWKFED